MKAISHRSSHLIEIFPELKAVVVAAPLSAGVFVLRHLTDTARTGLVTPGRRITGRRRTAQRTKRRRHPLSSCPGRPGGTLPPAVERRTRKAGGIVARSPHREE